MGVSLVVTLIYTVTELLFMRAVSEPLAGTERAVPGGVNAEMKVQ